MLVIGLTGGIGSGKTTVAHLFEKHGVTVIDTDQLSRDLTQPNQPALKKIIQEFGQQILNPDQTLNRTALRKIVFADEKKRKWLEELLHPLIRQKMKELIEQAQSPYCIVVIPLLFETKPNPLINRILVVDATPAQQIERTQIRDHLSAEDVKRILKTQTSRDRRLLAAHDIITNDNSIEHLASQVKQLHDFYLGEAEK